MIVIVGSRRFDKEIKEVTNFLVKNGVNIISAPYPDIEYDNSLISQWADKGLVYDHLFKLEGATSCLIYNPDGYVGVNTIFELGYFVKMNKPIYACFLTKETCIDTFINDVYNTVNKNELLSIIKKN